jgi:hypothetical protein
VAQKKGGDNDLKKLQIGVKCNGAILPFSILVKFEQSAAINLHRFVLFR